MNIEISPSPAEFSEVIDKSEGASTAVRIPLEFRVSPNETLQISSLEGRSLSPRSGSGQLIPYKTRLLAEEQQGKRKLIKSRPIQIRTSGTSATTIWVEILVKNHPFKTTKAGDIELLIRIAPDLESERVLSFNVVPDTNTLTLGPLRPKYRSSLLALNHCLIAALIGAVLTWTYAAEGTLHFEQWHDRLQKIGIATAAFFSLPTLTSLRRILPNFKNLVQFLRFPDLFLDSTLFSLLRKKTISAVLLLALGTIALLWRFSFTPIALPPLEQLYADGIREISQENLPSYWEKQGSIWSPVPSSRVFRKDVTSIYVGFSKWPKPHENNALARMELDGGIPRVVPRRFSIGTADEPPKVLSFISRDGSQGVPIDNSRIIALTYANLATGTVQQGSEYMAPTRSTRGEDVVMVWKKRRTAWKGVEEHLWNTPSPEIAPRQDYFTYHGDIFEKAAEHEAVHFRLILDQQNETRVDSADAKRLVEKVFEVYRARTYATSAPALCKVLGLLKAIKNANITLAVEGSVVEAAIKELEQSLAWSQPPDLDVIELQTRFLMCLAATSADPSAAVRLTERLFPVFQKKGREFLFVLLRASVSELADLPKFWENAFTNQIVDSKGDYKRFFETLFGKYEPKLAPVLPYAKLLSNLKQTPIKTAALTNGGTLRPKN